MPIFLLQTNNSYPGLDTVQYTHITDTPHGMPQISSADVSILKGKYNVTPKQFNDQKSTIGSNTSHPRVHMNRACGPGVRLSGGSPTLMLES